MTAAAIIDGNRSFTQAPVSLSTFFHKLKKFLTEHITIQFCIFLKNVEIFLNTFCS